MPEITPVVLCGGSGTRLWPVSRQAYPKQFAAFSGMQTLFQQCALRMSGTAGDLRFTAPIAVTNSDFRFIVTEQLASAGIDPGPVLIEPESRNTGPAVLAAAVLALKNDPDAVLLVAPSDHVIGDPAAFHASVRNGLEAVGEGRLVTFGIVPDRPETGYGYLQLGEALDGSGRPARLGKFIEKPDLERAAAMVASGTHLWNAGIFLFAARDIVAAYEAHAADLVEPVGDAVEQGRPDLGFLRLDPLAWARARAISIDFAVMEKASNISVVPFSGHWSDLGSWEAVLRESQQDEGGVAVQGAALAIDCENALLRSEAADLTLVGLGLKDIVAIATSDAVLVADLSRAQDVRLVVDALKARGARQATAFPKDHRPWGHSETLALADRFQVKRIVVKPGAALSLQSHVHRAEHWIVVSGTARITIDEEVKLVTENQSVFIPLGAVHRVENPGKVPMVLIEVQTGAYLGEDDIVRYEDMYARG